MMSFLLIHFFSIYISLPNKRLKQFISFTAGVGIAYVFIHLWPQVAVTQAIAEEEIHWLEGHVLHYALYLIALSGLTIFYTLHRLVVRAHANENIKTPNEIDSALFWANIGFFSLYNMIIGYLLTNRDEMSSTVLVFFVAFALHFITNDWHLRHHHESAYDHYGRYILSVSIVAGYAAGVWTDFPEYFIGSAEAFITGGMTLNVIKHELPSEEAGSLEGFLTGIVSAGALFTFI